MPKKPYKLKLDDKSPLLGLSASKKWILLANYLDESLMCNAVAMKTGRLLNMPFTNHIIPVDVTINGEYQGSYMFTEDKEVKKNRINIGENGVLLEMDTYFDQAPWQFKSPVYDLPVMIHYPELEDMPENEATPMFQDIETDFDTFEQKLSDPSFPNNDFEDYFDAESFVNYMIVYILTDNRELNHPKSTYIYKLSNEQQYRMGIIWDFDYGFGYEENVWKHFMQTDIPLIIDGNLSGTRFFKRVMEYPEIRALLKTKWAAFRSESYPKLIEYVNDYAERIKITTAMDHARWENGDGDSEKEKQDMITWLNQRVDYVDGYVGGL